MMLNQSYIVYTEYSADCTSDQFEFAVKIINNVNLLKYYTIIIEF